MGIEGDVEENVLFGVRVVLRLFIGECAGVELE